MTRTSDLTKTSLTPAQPSSRDEPGRAVAPTPRLRVLLVEDDDADAFLVKELLDEANAAVVLTVASSLAEARERIADADCVLLDLGLPDAQGLDGLRRLRAASQGAAICVLTGLGDDHIGAAAVAEGAQDYLIKGQVDGILLARSIRYAVERKRADENARRLHQVELQQQESARLERGLLPQPLLRTTDVRIDTFYRPGRRAQLGGDFYDVVQTAPDRLSMMVGDVCGHGVDEAALGVELRVAWRALTLAGVDDDAILPAIEQVLISERNREEVFATLVTVSVNLATGEAAIRLAGHPPPLLLVGGDAVTVPANHGPVLGVFERSERPASYLRLPRPDWSLMLYTDGLIEGRAAEGDGRLDAAGLRALITSAEARGLDTADLPGWLVARAEEANGGPLADDVAMLVLSPSRAPARTDTAATDGGVR
jgi:serine phosphatase RsbU (regulator of sigma subunit)